MPVIRRPIIVYSPGYGPRGGFWAWDRWTAPTIKVGPFRTEHAAREAFDAR